MNATENTNQNMTAEQMRALARRADTQSVEQLTTQAPTQEGRDIARAELDRRTSN